MKRSIYIACITGGFILATASSASVQAQNTQQKDTTVNRTVVVEQEYNPNILDASKVNVLPKVEEPTVSKKDVEYATTFFPATSIPAGLMRPYVGREVQPDGKFGYVRAGYGNYGNLDLLGNYLFQLSDQDKLNVRFQMDGSDGKLEMLDGALDWNRYYYRTRANVDFTHQFDKVNLNIAANFGLSNFNFSALQIGKQKFTSGDLHVGVSSTDESAPIKFEAETNLMIFNRQNNNTSIFGDAIGETQIHTKGEISGAISEEQSIHIGLDMRNLFYNKDLVLPEGGGKVYENRTALGLNPYYKLGNDNWNLHAGAHVDFSLGSGKSLRVSPDIMAQYIFSDSYVLYAQATGGKLVNDFRRLEMISPYGLPGSRINDTYEQLNAALGFKTSPYPGLWFNIYGGYQKLKDDLYESSLYIIDNADPLAMTSLTDRTTVKSYLDLPSENTNNFYAGIKLSYDYKDIISVSTAFTYRDWDANDKKALIMKPNSEVNLNVDFRPVTGLNMSVGYDYIGRTKVNDIRVAEVSDLHLGASYNLFKDVSVYARVNNILNKDYQYYLDYPTEGVNFLGGLSFRF